MKPQMKFLATIFALIISGSDFGVGQDVPQIDDPSTINTGGFQSIMTLPFPLQPCVGCGFTGQGIVPVMTLPAPIEPPCTDCGNSHGSSATHTSGGQGQGYGSSQSISQLMVTIMASAAMAQAAAEQQKQTYTELSQAAMGAMAVALGEQSLATQAQVAVQAAEVVDQFVESLVSKISKASQEANALSSQAALSAVAMEEFSSQQQTMAWEAQQAANNLYQQQNLAMNYLQQSMIAAEQAKAAASKANSGSQQYGYGGNSGH